MTDAIIAIPDGKIADYIDGKIRSDTPEEYVRQNIERRLILELGYSSDQIAIEFPIKLGSRPRLRVDIAIFQKGLSHTQENAWILVECKRDSIQPTDKKDGVEQLKSYMAACPNVDWGMWTNGRYKAVYRKVVVDGRIGHEEPNDIPPANGDLASVDRPTRDSLSRAADDNLLFSFKICHDHIYVTDGLQKQPAFFELLKIIFCKIHDERNWPNPLSFYATASEKASHDGRLTVKNRVGKIFNEVKKRYPAIFDANSELELQPRSLAYIIGELQRYSFLDTNVDVKGKAYEELVGANLRGDRGEFFTPRNVQAMAIRMLDIQPNEKVLDPACGTGGFLVIALAQIIKRIRDDAGELKSDQQKSALDDRIREIAARGFFGLDINPDLVKATKMNMVMNNDGSGNIMRTDSLLHPHQWDSDFRQSLAEAVGVSAASIRGPENLGFFDVVATNPPFGSTLPIKDTETLSQYRLGHVWRKESERWVVTSQIATSSPPEILFIERCWQFLKPGGRMAIVLPDAILGAPKLTYVRQWIFTNCRIVASVDLHPDTFQPRNGTQTSVLILQRKSNEEIQSEAAQQHIRDYDVFMAQVHAMGRDKRGNTVFVRNEEGEELLVPQELRGDSILERLASGVPTVRALPRTKIIDDESPHVADEFLAWKDETVLGW